MSTYKLIHTAEDVDYKLSLLEYGKNLLPYPYYSGNNASIESNSVLTDYGDGSILVHGTITASKTEILLDETCILAPGTYTISINTTDDSMNVIEDNRFYLMAVVTTESNNETISYNEITTSCTFTLEEQAHIKTFLVIDAEVDTEIKLLTIKPQIECGDVASNWKPYMSTVNNYIDNRFNGIKTKLSTHYYTQKQIDNTVSALVDQDIAILSAAQEYTDIKTSGIQSTAAIVEQVKNILASQLTLGYGADDKVYIYLNDEQIGTGIDVSILL